MFLRCSEASACGQLQDIQSSFQSEIGTVEFFVITQNAQDPDVILYWLDYDGDVTFVGYLNAGGTNSVRSTVGHVLLAKRSDDVIMTLNGECAWRVDGVVDVLVVENLWN